MIDFNDFFNKWQLRGVEDGAINGDWFRGKSPKDPIQRKRKRGWRSSTHGGGQGQ